MTFNELRSRIERENPYFFSPDTLRFFGERLSDMYLFKRTQIITDSQGEEHECYVISSYQRNHPLGPRRAYHYFDTETYERILPE